MQNLPTGLGRTSSGPLLGTDKAVFLATFIPVLVVFLALASWTVFKSPDPLTNMATASSLAKNGTLYLDAFADLTEPPGRLAWVVETERGRIVSIYPPGAALHAAPLYLFWPGEGQVRPGGDRGRYPEGVPLPPLGPGALVGAITAALAVALAAMTARPYATGVVAVAGGFLLALGTSTLTVAADDLWQHGPAMMWALVAVYLASRGRYVGSGAAFAAAILVRPPVAVIAACVGLTIAIRERRLRPAATIGAISMVGVVILIAYNYTVFGSVTGAYAEHFSGTLASTDAGAYLLNIIGGLFDPRLGLLTWSSFIVVAVIGTVHVRSSIPAALAGAFIGSVAYLLVTWKSEHFAGGGGFVGYRYPLTAVAVAAPALMLSWQWIRARRWVTLTFLVTVALSLSLFVGAEVISLIWYER